MFSWWSGLQLTSKKVSELIESPQIVFLAVFLDLYQRLRIQEDIDESNIVLANSTNTDKFWILK